LNYGLAAVVVAAVEKVPQIFLLVAVVVAVDTLRAHFLRLIYQQRCQLLSVQVAQVALLNLHLTLMEMLDHQVIIQLLAHF
jgi:hypothetical protein